MSATVAKYTKQDKAVHTAVFSLGGDTLNGRKDVRGKNVHTTIDTITHLFNIESEEIWREQTSNQTPSRSQNFYLQKFQVSLCSAAIHLSQDQLQVPQTGLLTLQKPAEDEKEYVVMKKDKDLLRFFPARQIKVRTLITKMVPIPP